MSGLDYSTFSLCSALTPTPSTSCPDDDIICNPQREDLFSSSHRPRARAFALSGPHQGQGLPNPTDDIQGNILCAQLGEFHFGPQYADASVNPPTAISENPPWSSPHSLHYPTPVRGSISNSERAFPEDARPGLTPLQCDVNMTIPARRGSMAIITDRQLDLASPLPGMAMDVSPFLPGGMITSPSPPPTAYHEDGPHHCAHPFAYADQLRQQAPFDRPTVHSLGAFQEPAHPSIISPDHPFPAAMATPFPGYPPHDHPICEPTSFSTAIHAQHLPRPGSAPPLIDSQVPFVGDPRAALQSFPEHAAPSDVTRQHAWPPQPCAAQSPRSSPRRAGSIGHNAQKTPPSSRHLRRWSSVTHPALRASPPFPSPLAPNVVPFPRYPAQAPDSAYFSPCSESETDETPAYPMPHASAALDRAETAPSDPSPQLPMRTVVRCDGHLIDEESWTAALARPDKLVHVYECFWDVFNTPCGMWIEGDQSSVADHLALFHGFRGGEVTTRCLWRECPKPHMKGTSIARHVVTHIGSRVKCHACKHEFARVDACNRAHSRSGCLGVGQPMYGELQRVLDARKVDPLPLQRPNKKRRTDE